MDTKPDIKVENDIKPVMKRLRLRKPIIPLALCSPKVKKERIERRRLVRQRLLQERQQQRRQRELQQQELRERAQQQQLANLTMEAQNTPTVETKVPTNAGTDIFNVVKYFCITRPDVCQPLLEKIQNILSADQ